jgi:predicted lipoprotein with Yx(FWY)xxD motif
VSIARLLLAGTAAAVLVATTSACGGNDYGGSGAQQSWTSSSPYSAAPVAGTAAPAAAAPASAADQSPQAAAAASAAAPPAEGIVVQRLVAASLPKIGEGVTDGKGWVLYRFSKDTASPPRSNCKGACAQKWPPVLSKDTPQLANIPYENVGWLLRGDGSRQLTLNGWPLYRYTGDAKPGQWKGQGVDDKWFVVLKNGAKNSHGSTPSGSAAATSDAGGKIGY